jgi:hypothetical protein
VTPPPAGYGNGANGGSGSGSGFNVNWNRLGHGPTGGDVAPPTPSGNQYRWYQPTQTQTQTNQPQLTNQLQTQAPSQLQAPLQLQAPSLQSQFQVPMQFQMPAQLQMPAQFQAPQFQMPSQQLQFQAPSQQQQFYSAPQQQSPQYQFGGGYFAMSDENVKQEIKPADTDLRSFLQPLGAYSYEYKDPKHGVGRFVSPMAQELEQSEIGKSAVIETADGKMVDYGRLAGIQLAATAMVNKRLNSLERKLSRK